MTVESASLISQLNPLYPQAGDPKSEGDDHLRLIKTCIQTSLPVDTRNLNTNARFGQVIRYDGTSLNVGVRARFGEWQSTSDLSVPNTTYALFAFPNSPNENGFGHAWASSGKLTAEDHSKFLAFRLIGTLRVTNPLQGDYIRVRVRKNSNVAVSGPYDFYPGQQYNGVTNTQIDWFFPLEPGALIGSDVFYFEIGYVASGTLPPSRLFLSGAKLQLFDMG